MATRKTTSKPAVKKTARKTVSRKPATRKATPAAVKAPKAKGKAVEVKGEDFSYPFATKAQIRERLTTDDKAVLAALDTLGARHAGRRPGEKRHGFMSSHAVHGMGLFARAQSRKPLTPDEMKRARALVLHYVSQLAAHERELALAKNPDLVKVATLYGVATK